VELVNNGTAKLVDADPIKIKEEFDHFYELNEELEYPAFYGDGLTAEFILREILMMFEK
jgi:phage-related protein